MVSFKNRLKELRQKNQMTMKELGEKLGYSESTISMYESGKRQPKTSNDYIRIADFFEVTVDYLLGRTDNPNAFIQILDYNNKNYEFELDKLVLPNGLTYEEMVEAIKDLKEKNAKLEEREKIIKEAFKED